MLERTVARDSPSSLIQLFRPGVTWDHCSHFALVTNKMEALALVPRDGTSTEDAFTKLATNFKLSEVVKDALIRSKLENLEEFRFLFDEESKVEPWVVKLKLGEDHTVQAARLRGAWSAARLYFQQSEQDRSKVTASDLDSMLGDTELRDTKLQFWRRYRQRYPAEVHPSDATLSLLLYSGCSGCSFNLLAGRQCY